MFVIALYFSVKRANKFCCKVRKKGEKTATTTNITTTKQNDIRIVNVIVIV